MTTTKPKMKGILKGFKYISQIFDENEKQDEIEIGLPTDVKHVAHIGWDGPTTNNDNPSWMKEFDSSAGFQSAPLSNPTEQPKEEPEVQWVSEDSKARKPPESPADVPKTRKPRRRNHSKDGSETPLDPSIPADPARKARRKKSKDLEGSTRARSKQVDQPDKETVPDLMEQ